MAPIKFWGEITSTLNWCERDYEVSPFFVEFYNTISNLGIILPPLYGIFEVLRLGVEKKFILTHLALIIVGIGSWFFHMTLLYSMQLADELPMVYGSTILVYQTVELHKNPKKPINWTLILLLFVYSFLFTSVYLIFKNPLIHQTTYGILVMILLILDLRICYRNDCESCTKLLRLSFFLYFFGFGLWNMDNQLCGRLEELRAILPKGVGPLSQCHALWHLLTGYSAYLLILFKIHARGHLYKPMTKMSFNCFGITLSRDLKNVE